VKILVNACISKVDRIGMEGRKTEKGSVAEFTSERDERVKVLVNSCISKVDRIGMKAEFTSERDEGMKIHVHYATLTSAGWLWVASVCLVVGAVAQCWCPERCPPSPPSPATTPPHSQG